MEAYRLTHIDGKPLPIRLVVFGFARDIGGGRFWFEPQTQSDVALGADGCICWDLEECSAADARPRTVMFARHQYRRLDATRVQFPVDRNNVAAEYTAELDEACLTLRSQTEGERESSPTRLYGSDHAWRFALAPEEHITSWQAKSEPCFVVTTSNGGREIRWLGWLLTCLSRSVYRWRFRRRLRKPPLNSL